jgi:hypothetical protein
MSDSSNAPVKVGTPPVVLPPLVWIGSHPTMEDPEMRGTRLRRCVRCNTRSTFNTIRCEPGMVVHLIDPADVHADPELFDGVQWAEPSAIEGAHKHWRRQGFQVERLPGGQETLEHPRFRACPTCNTEAMAAGTLLPLHLPAPAPRAAR